jgi:hypothetical protein
MAALACGWSVSTHVSLCRPWVVKVGHARAVTDAVVTGRYCCSLAVQKQYSGQCSRPPMHANNDNVPWCGASCQSGGVRVVTRLRNRAEQKGSAKYLCGDRCVVLLREWLLRVNVDQRALALRCGADVKIHVVDITIIKMRG